VPRTSKSTKVEALLRSALRGLEAERGKMDERIRQLRGFLGMADAGTAAKRGRPAKRRKRRALSAAARERIAAAQRRRWAAFRKQAKAKAKASRKAKPAAATG